MPTGHICFFVGDISLSGGTERAVATITSGLVERHWQVSIVSMRRQSEQFFPLHPGITVHTIYVGNERVRHRPFHAFFKLRKIARACKFQHWVDAETVLSAYSVPPLAGLGIRHFAWENFHLHERLGSVLRPFGRAIAAYLCRGVIVLTQADRKAWLARFGDSRAIHQIPHCVKSSPPVSDMSLERRNPVVLAMGRHCNQKGFDLLLKAWARVCTKHPSWRVRIVGSGELTLELKDLAQTLGISAQVEWIAQTTDVEGHYSDASVFALSSRFEGFGIVLIEALSHGVPVVSFRCHHGPEEIIEDQQSGLLVENGNVLNFAQALDQMITDDGMRKRMAQAALKRSEMFEPPLIIEQWEKVLTA